MRAKPITPNLFIAGAPKAGTTALNHYLNQHPDIFMVQKREPTHFGRDFKYQNQFHDMETYLELFKETNGCRWVGEKSVWYMYSKNAAREIHEFCPTSKILMVIRHPVDQIISAHNYFVFSGMENVRSLAKAIKLEPLRAKGQHIPPLANLPEGLQYTSVARYTEQVKRFIDIFGRDQVKIIIYDDLKNEPEQIVREVFKFLDVDQAVPLELEAKNVAKRTRSLWLRDLLLRQNKPFPLNMVPPKLRRLAGHVLRKWNAPKRGTPQVDQSIRQSLHNQFIPEIEALEKLIKRDLTHWK